MTVHDLATEPSDVAAAALGYRVGVTPERNALVSTVLEHPALDSALRLSILGASHAVTLMIDGRDAMTEEVSCRATADGGAPLPAEESFPGPWGVHHLRGTTETLAAADFGAVVERLTSLAAADPTVLAGRFPGSDGALSVVAPTPDDTGWSWVTWHLYPAGDDSGECGGDVVATTSRLHVAGVHVAGVHVAGLAGAGVDVAEGVAS
ncbi:DUF2617 family protein [Dietzia sp. SL131]|uniref:DUF2617 family protein n=1 Tax=Dietzia sp. SL131 TaxID=2995149 RepID=UPI00227B7BDF|nr:DUF2617 family protein [Dietzia sp. SL131]MCY1656798.1 DUF2617 family protein [Dietzia sp. SL131]